MTIRIGMASGKSLLVDGPSISIGTDPGCAVIVPSHPGIQPVHATIRRIAGRWIIESGGDWLLRVESGVPGRKQWLATGDRIALTATGPEIVFSGQDGTDDGQMTVPQAVTAGQVVPESRSDAESGSTDSGHGREPHGREEAVTPVTPTYRRTNRSSVRRLAPTRYKLAGAGFCLLALLLIAVGYMTHDRGGITFAERINARTYQTRNEGNRFRPGFVHLLVSGRYPFGDNRIILYQRRRGGTVWTVLNEDTVHPDVRTCVLPIFLPEPGDYDIRAATSQGNMIAEGGLHIVSD